MRPLLKLKIYSEAAKTESIYNTEIKKLIVPINLPIFCVMLVLGVVYYIYISLLGDIFRYIKKYSK